MGIGGFYILLVATAHEPLEAPVGELESRLETASGVIERFLPSKQDERDFSVRLTRKDHSIEWLEVAPKKLFTSSDWIRRETFADNYEAVILKEGDQDILLGLAPREFGIVEPAQADEKFCKAMARVSIPTALNDQTDLPLSDLKCEQDLPTTVNSFVRVIGKQNKNWTSCDPKLATCIWDYSIQNEGAAATQVSVFSYLEIARKELALHSLKPAMGSLTAKAWTTKADKSSYNADLRTLFYGSGKYLDGFDGFVVVHEWGHAVVDDLNRGLYGYEARVFQETMADFIAAQTFDDPCFAPYDAQEVPNRKCIRTLTNEKVYPKDMRGNDPHEDSLLLSAALWEARKILPPGLALELSLESLTRLPKKITLPLFWQKLMQVYERLLAERTKLPDKKNELSEIGRRRGLLQ